jgi:hypothetical protein
MKRNFVLVQRRNHNCHIFYSEDASLLSALVSTTCSDSEVSVVWVDDSLDCADATGFFDLL